jgi:hypothetical protein
MKNPSPRARLGNATIVENFLYKGHSIELKYNQVHLWSIFIDGYWRETCTNSSEDGTNRSVVIEAKRLVDSESGI